MPIHVESRRKKPAAIEKLYPGAAVIDVTSKGPEPWVRFSPFFPHGGIPVPNCGLLSESVEGVWQGLKVFANEDVDPAKFAIRDMEGIKRGGKRRGAVRGHRFGVGGDELLGYRDARYRIYLPAYRWVLENNLGDELAALRLEVEQRPVVLLDYETNANVDDLRVPLSHASLVKRFLEGDWPEFIPAGEGH